MNDPRAKLLAALVPAVSTATGKLVTTVNPIAVNGSGQYPFVWIQDMYLDESGTKRQYHTTVTAVINIQYKNSDSLIPLHADMDAVMQLANEAAPFSIASPFTVMDCTLDSSVLTDFQIDDGRVNVGIVRLRFRIAQDK